MSKIKICGLFRHEDIEAVNQSKPDYMGFIFANSKRRVTPAQARHLKEHLDPSIKAVGVFVNAGINDIVSLTADGTIDLIQLHGDEDAPAIEQLKNHTSAPIIKAVHVQNTEQIQQAAELPCEFLLLDTYTKGVYGGGGTHFDWGLIPEIHKPFFLAGGLDIENVEQAINTCHPYCVDISSGVETDGIKDSLKIENIVRKVRNIK